MSKVHQWMQTARAAGLDYVPAVAYDSEGRTVVDIAGRCWECIEWMRGRADYQEYPTEVKLTAAVDAIARIHQSWFTFGEATCPAVHRRLAVLDDWRGLERPRFAVDDPIAEHAQSAWVLLPTLAPRMQAMLEPWSRRLVSVQPCIGDVWHDHVLFEGDAVTGVIDFAAAKIDHVAADLARLLGSLIPDDRLRMETALRAYSAVRPLPNPELVAILDQTGVVASVVNWLRRIYLEKEQVANRIAVAKRLASLLDRIKHG